MAEIPKDALVTENDDIVLLGTPPSYRAQLVRLAAQEKGIKWREYLVDIHGALTQLEPWYIKLNPGAYVPTMVTHPNNTGVGESAIIVTYMEENFNFIQLIVKGFD